MLRRLSFSLLVDDRKTPIMACGDGCAPFDGWQSLAIDETMMEVDLKHEWVHGNSCISTSAGIQNLFH